MSLDVPVVRVAITQDGIRHIPGLRIFQTEGLRVRTTTSPCSHKASSLREQAVETSKSADAPKHQSSNQEAGTRMPKRKGRVGSASGRTTAMTPSTSFR